MIDFQQLASLALFLILLLLGFILVLISFIPISFGVTVTMLGRDRWFSLCLGVMLFLSCFWLLSSGAFPKVVGQTLASAVDTPSRVANQSVPRPISTAAGQVVDCIPMTSSGQSVPTLNIRNSRWMDDRAVMVEIQCPQSKRQSTEANSTLTFLEDGGNVSLNQGWAKVRYEITGWVAKDRLEFPNP